jgi:tRNA (mo5U34)-methyltransferase
MIESRAHPAPPVPAGFDGSALFDGIHWHQRWEVFEGVYLPGRNDVHRLLEYVGLPADLTGKRVLDVGAWNGGFSFECERRGASEVVALSLEDPETTGFNRLQAVLGSKVSYALESVYNLDPEVLGQFDVVLFLGVLYHLRYPLLAADKLRSVTTGELFIETHVIDECFISAGKTSAESQSLATISTSLSDVPLWQFYRRDELGGDPSNWFGPNVCGVLEGFGSAGFDVGVTHRWGTRAGFRATPVPRADFERTYEGQSPVLQKGLKLRLADPPASGTT